MMIGGVSINLAKEMSIFDQEVTIRIWAAPTKELRIPATPEILAALREFPKKQAWEMDEARANRFLEETKMGQVWVRSALLAWTEAYKDHKQQEPDLVAIEKVVNGEASE